MEVMHKSGLIDLLKANHDRIPGWRLLREYLTPYEEEGGQTAMLQVFETCTDLIRTLPLLQHDELHPEDAADKPHEVTHAPESVRYGVRSRPPITKQPKQELSGIAEYKDHLAKASMRNRRRLT